MKPIEDSSPLIKSRAASKYVRPKVYTDQMIIAQDMHVGEGVGPMKSIELKIKPA